MTPPLDTKEIPSPILDYLSTEQQRKEQKRLERERELSSVTVTVLRNKIELPVCMFACAWVHLPVRVRLTCASSLCSVFFFTVSAVRSFTHYLSFPPSPLCSRFLQFLNVKIDRNSTLGQLRDEVLKLAESENAANQPVITIDTNTTDTQQQQQLPRLQYRLRRVASRKNHTKRPMQLFKEGEDYEKTLVDLGIDKKPFVYLEQFLEGRKRERRRRRRRRGGREETRCT